MNLCQHRIVHTRLQIRSLHSFFSLSSTYMHTKPRWFQPRHSTKRRDCTISQDFIFSTWLPDHSLCGHQSSFPIFILKLMRESKVVSKLPHILALVKKVRWGWTWRVYDSGF
ncbi:hypothetical protein sscle_05g042230 [Sclerotinia sclerotiorum 1980 UF-70]|uniref:Uncharacterized protein n=1 Tax=Sclerotinia sclerotiorum (strain ATCC 18683 / 1980 / Ss-1) TaxID=665079 RepID=A0A1D9Q4G1_SCLS1|nr:hypothetical protein sscle_05g042230 [Sclerotinia sclerotiorum 1980 UF-70]